MTVQKGDQITKRVDFAAKDDEQQVATGIVMVPDVVDLQGDYATDETISRFADQFAAFIDAGEAEGGVMHAVWPTDHITLDDNQVLEDATEIGGRTAPAGAWVQSWKFEDTELWALVSDGILEGYSIGAVDVEWSDPMRQDDLPDGIEVAEDYPEDQPVWELRDGLIREVSAVDIPAVPDAQILATKADAQKRLAHHLGNREGFIDEARDRGHSEDEAERLWEYLNRAIDVEGAGTPGTKGRLTAAGKAFLDALTGSSSDSGDAERSPSTSKESRTLSSANRERLMAAHDAVEDALASDVEFSSNRFTDDPTVDFNVADYGKAGPTSPSDEQTDKNAPGGETPDPDDTKQMSDDDPLADAPDWAKALHNDVQKNSTQIDTLAEKITDPDDPDDPEKAWEDAPAWAKALREEQEKNRNRVDELAAASGKSQQLSGNGDEPEGPTKADVLGLPGGEA